jgi:hypothetical protein
VASGIATEPLAQWEKDLLVGSDPDPIAFETFVKPDGTYGYRQVRGGDPVEPQRRNGNCALGMPGCDCGSGNSNSNPFTTFSIDPYVQPYSPSVEDRGCAECKRKDEKIKALGEEQRGDAKTIKAHESTITDLTGKLREAEAKRDEYDGEADRLAAAYDAVVIERDYLLQQMEWANAELLKAWGELEGRVA